MEERHKGRQPDRDYDESQPKRARSAGHFGEFQSGPSQQRGTRRSSQPARSTPPQFSGWKSGNAGYSEIGQSSRSAGSQVDGGFSQARPPRPQCSYWGRHHPGECYRATGACFGCGRQGHTVRECPYRGGPGGMAQPTGSAAGSSSPSVAGRPAERDVQRSAGRGRGRGGASSSGGPSNRIYALTGRQDSETLSNADAGTLLFFP